MDLVNFDNLVLDYGRNIGVSPSSMNDKEMVEQQRAAKAEQAAQQQMMEAGPDIANAAKTASETDIGGGQSVLNAMLG